jgi:hypothetical protein
VIQAASIREALKLYEKHGWTLRRVLLNRESRAQLAGELSELFGAAAIEDFARDGAWFSRASGKDREAWELRLFGDAPFALVEVFGPAQSEKEREEARRAIEERMLETDPSKMVRQADEE